MYVFLAQSNCSQDHWEDIAVAGGNSAVTIVGAGFIKTLDMMKFEKIILFASILFTLIVITFISGSVYYLSINKNKLYDIAKDLLTRGEEDISEHPRLSKLDGDYEIWKYTPEHINTSRVIYLIPGGAYLTCTPNISVLDRLSLNYVIYIITYPVLPNLFVDTLNYTSSAFNYLNEINKEAKITIMSISAGSLLAVQSLDLINTTNIDQLITISGYFGYASVKDYFVKMADKLYLTGALTKAKPLNTIPLEMKLLILASNDDARLGGSSEYFAKLNSVPVHWFSGGHEFWSQRNNPDTFKAYKLVEQFINND